MQRHIFSILLFMSLANSAPLAGQEDPCLNRSLPIIVLAPSAVPVTAIDLEVYVGKKPANVLSIAPDASPHRILILLDTSGSVLTTPGPWALYLALATNLIANLPPEDAVGIAAFSDNLEFLVPFTQDRQVLQQELRRLSPGKAAFPKKPRATALYDSLIDAVKLFGPPQQGDLIYVLSDGEDDASRFRAQDAMKAMQSSGVSLYSISIEEGSDKYERAKERQFQEFVANLGGAGIIVSSKDLSREGPLVDHAGTTTARGAVWLELLQLLPRLTRIEIALTERLGRDAFLVLRGPNPQAVEIRYLVGLNSCLRPRDPANAKH
ncbi:MAG: VWA domain-containing protein [Candidatus Acidiferrales bacterium]